MDKLTDSYIFEVVQSNMKIFSIGMTQKQLECLQESIKATLARPKEKGMVGIIALRLDRDVIKPAPGESLEGKTAYEQLQGRKGK